MVRRDTSARKAGRALRTVVFTRSRLPPLRSMYSVPEGKIVKVGVLGATGTVGQRFIALLETHPYFVVHALGASARSAGKAYHLATNWKQTTPIPSGVRDIEVKLCGPEHFKECAIVFSGLDADVAGDIGMDPKFFSLFALTRSAQCNCRGRLSRC
jgi:Semialdehyde dehydrogenase, NAD binding domain